MKLKELALAQLSFLIFMISGVQAAELLDVKAVTSGSDVTIEVSADIPMTYTYYKILGQARAVLDIADADPEKIEPLIIVNRGIVSSISVDKAQISEMTVSRLIFNLTRAADILVTASADRKRLTATFAPTPAALPAPAPAETKKTVLPEPAESVPVMTPQDNKAADEAKEPDQSKPFAELKRGFDDPKSILANAAKPSSVKVPAPAPAAPAPAPAQPVSTPASEQIDSTPKLEPTVQESYSTSSATIKSIKTGSSYIEIQTSGNFSTYKIIKLSNPERIAIDIPGAKSLIKSSTVQINKFGISRARLGVYPQYVRIVLDSTESVFPKHSITNSANALRINFN